MKLTVLCLLLILTSINVYARLGNTSEQCDERYSTSFGIQQRKYKEILIKNYGGTNLVVSCRFYKNLCFEMGVARLDSDGIIKSLKPEEVVAFIRTNLGFIPKDIKDEEVIAPNATQRKIGSDGRYVWIEEQTKTGIITILRDNTLAPSK